MSQYLGPGDATPHSTRLGVRGFRRRFSILLATVLSILLPLSTTFMVWKGLCLLTNSGIPIVCVVSESMAPAFHRGDVLILWNRTASIRAGDIPVVWFDGNPLPMVHRVVQVFTRESVSSQDQSAGQMFLTKGDNNPLDDVSLYPEGRTLVSRGEVIGFVRGFIPLIGWIVIGFQEIAWVKYLVYTTAAIILLSP